MSKTYIPIPPCASGTIDSLAASGYSEKEALADIIDNSIQAGSTRIDININLESRWLEVKDNGCGMSNEQVVDAFIYGNREKSKGLSKFGIGLKAASTSLGDKVIVLSNDNNENIDNYKTCFILDLGDIKKENKWQIAKEDTCHDIWNSIVSWINNKREGATGENITGTVVRVENLKNLLDRDFAKKEGKVYEKAKEKLFEEIVSHLGTSHERFLEKVDITLEGRKIKHKNSLENAELILEKKEIITGIKGTNELKISLYKSDLLSGVFYYREDRLIGGGLLKYGIKKSDKLALIFEYTEDLDNVFRVDMKKTKIEKVNLAEDVVRDIEKVIKEYKKQTLENKDNKVKELVTDEENKEKVDSNLEVKKVGFIDNEELVEGTSNLNIVDKDDDDVDEKNDKELDEKIEVNVECKSLETENLYTNLEELSKEELIYIIRELKVNCNRDILNKYI